MSHLADLRLISDLISNLLRSVLSLNWLLRVLRLVQLLSEDLVLQANLDKLLILVRIHALHFIGQFFNGIGQDGFLLYVGDSCEHTHHAVHPNLVIIIGLREVLHIRTAAVVMQ